MISNYERTPEIRKKIADKLRGNRHTLATRRKMSRTRMGHAVSDETKRKISLKQLGNKHALGHRHSAAAKRKMAIAALGNTRFLGRRHTAASKKKVSIANKGHSVSVRQRKQISIAKKGIKHTIETRRKMSLSQKARWDKVPKQRRLEIVAAALASQKGGPSSIEHLIRNCLLSCKIKFEPQKMFFPYRVDIFIPSLNLAVECDGGYWHNRPGSKEYDQQRDCYLVHQYKIKIVRIPEAAIRKDPKGVVDAILVGKQVVR